MLSKLFKSRKGVTGASIAAAVGVSALFALASASAANGRDRLRQRDAAAGERTQPGVRGDVDLGARRPGRLRRDR